MSRGGCSRQHPLEMRILSGSGGVGKFVWGLAHTTATESHLHISSG
eukprot:gene2012-biopygen11233